jgi:predicted ribosome quality control (RQC) complex YloA/Tae2 family protein
VTDYFDPALPNVTIPLDPSVELRLQIDRLYARAKRLEAGVAKTREEIDRAEREGAAIRAALSQLSQCQDSDAVDGLRASLETRRLLPARRAAPPRPRIPAPKDPLDALRRFRSADGLEILVGKNDRQNDLLTLRVARGNDLWLHAGGGQGGSHVVVRLPRDQSAPLETLLDAAALAVHFSQARGAARAEVIYTQRKHVSKPRGAPPGRVAVRGEKRLTVDFDRARLDRLLAGNRPNPGESE